MAPNKMEQHIKEKLNNRTLQPSANAWNTLSERLDNQAKKTKSASYWWLGLAASIVGVLLVTTLFDNKETNVENTPVIVDSPQPIEQNNVLQEAIKIPGSNRNNVPTTVNEKINKKAIIVATNNNSQELEIKNETKTSVEVVVKELTFEEQKIQEVVAQIQVLKDNNVGVTDSEIDALLLEAQKEINLNQLYSKKGLVDAKSLLQDVEADIDQSFRSKVFEAFKDGFGTVKSAVANRNN